jgi:uncharacterized protein YjbI with pentapeptide repeats
VQLAEDIPSLNIELKNFDKFDVRNAKESRSDKEGANLRIGKLRLSNNWWAYLSNSILSF